MKKQTKLSVIIPAFNEEQNIKSCVESILDQDYPDYEVIVVDDGSKDHTLKILSELTVNNRRLKILKQNHGGPGKARNLGAKAAGGEILVFMDADMTFEKNFLSDLVKPIVDKKVKGTFSKEEYISNWDNVWSRCWNINQNWPQQKMIPDDYPDEGLDFRAILKEDFLKVGGFDDVGYTDTWSLSQKLGFKPKSVKGAKYYHSNPDNLSEVFIQSRWSAKREYKFGVLGKIVALIRFFAPVSLLIGVYKAGKYKEPGFVIFKLVYDLGGFLGVLDLLLGRKLSK